MISLDQISLEDFPRICRMCLKLGNHKYIFQTPHLISIFNVVTSLKLEEDDKLPKTACESCLNILKNIEEFTTICKSSYSTLITVVIQEQDKHRNSLSKSTSENVYEKIQTKREVDEESDNTSDQKEKCINSKNDDDTGWNEDYHETEYENSLKQRKNSLVCIYCKATFSRSNHLQTHLRMHSGIKPFKCGICFTQFTRKSSLTAHKLVHSSEKSQTKSELRKRAVKHTNRDRLPKHDKPKRKWNCVYCEKIFTKRDDLQRHVRIHTGYRPFQCKLCDKKFTQNSTLIRHVHSIHIDQHPDQNYFECYICEKKFIRKDHLEQHVINLHVTRQGFLSSSIFDSNSCNECGKIFSLVAYLEQHMERVHDKVDRSNVKTKIKKEKVETNKLSTPIPKLCSICGKLFQKVKTYHAHMSRCHSLREKKPKDNTKPKEKYQCWHCGKIVNTHCNLAVHLRVHTGEKPYQCKFCPRRFSVWTCRQEHENIHTGVKPFQCEPCDKGFKQRSALLKHLRSAIHRIQVKT